MNMISFSGGKDSTAMLLRMIELDYKIDKIVFADSGFEFPELYEYIKRIEKHIGREITILKTKEGLFKEWFYGKVTRGHNIGKVRGFPLRFFPCWWSRESKVKPLSKIGKDCKKVYVGIAYDEKRRIRKGSSNIEYPLVDWKWTEKDCVNYLNKKGLLNPLYTNFNRLGCYFCPKQNDGSLYVLWYNYSELWRNMVVWDKETKKIKGHFIKEQSLENYEIKFIKGWIPDQEAKYECKGCVDVKKAFQYRQMSLNCMEE